MNKREDVLREALQQNAEETERWQTFLKENETAKDNLDMFQKRLSVDVMVPVGKKAFMPGSLIHTNEILVGHYQGYFSKCSTSKANEICDLRIKMGKEHLKKLETELELWQNKLEKPYTEGIVPSGEEREIIEDYNEEQETLWKQQHRQRLKEAKLKERKVREKTFDEQRRKQVVADKANEKSEEEIFKMLEDAEIMEELEEELENLQIEEVNDETIRKLMSGEMQLPPEKKRLAYAVNTEEPTKELAINAKIVKKVAIQEQVPATNNNIVPNPDLIADEAEANEEDEPLPKEVQIIKEQARFLNIEDQIGFYEYQTEIIRQKLMSLPLRAQEDMDEKIHLLMVLEHLEELLEVAETAAGIEELAEMEENEIIDNESANEVLMIEDNQKIDENLKSSILSAEKKGNQKRRISFALEDQTLEFCKNEAVTQMLTDKNDEIPKRDVITLDDDDGSKTYETQIIPTSPTLDKKDLIKSKVEQNLQFMSETQSKQDFDLVNKILETSMGKVNTLHIKFKHTQLQSVDCNKACSKDVENIPGTPADFYSLYVRSLNDLKKEETSTIYVNSYEGEDQVKAPVLKESDRQQAYEDPKAEFSIPKSILRNKTEIEKENHIPTVNSDNKQKTKKSKKKRTPKEEDECLSAYDKVMHDVVEKPLSEPEPLPEGKYIDAHTPKRRVSRFKQMRQASEKT